MYRILEKMGLPTQNDGTVRLIVAFAHKTCDQIEPPVRCSWTERVLR
jgi:hypothetical protein